MSTIGLDRNNNIKILDNNINLINGVDELSQTLKNKISLCKGENPFNTEDGLDYDSELLDKLGGVDHIKNNIKNIILKEDDVLGIENTDTSIDNNKLTIINKIKTSYGTIVI